MLALPAVLSSVELAPGVILADDVVSPVRAEGSLKKLIYCLGPWKQGEQVEDFADRFIKHAAAPYLAKSKDHVNRLAARFSSSAKTVESINLQDLAAEEKYLLMDLLQHLYALVESGSKCPMSRRGGNVKMTGRTILNLPRKIPLRIDPATILWSHG